ncbi:MAG: HAD family phosphatase [Bacteroides sp.]|nr:HAD family phosphatase [Bacteroides sp.]MCM1550350.1 HAD family phosphatase [Clostridium sp.]
MESKKIKGVIFDFNGTMFFDEAFQKQSWLTFLENKTGRSISEVEFQEYVHGRNAEDTLSYFLNQELSQEEVAALEEEKEVVYRRLCMECPEAFRLAEGLPRFLEQFVQRKIPITIATASGWNNVQFFFEQLHLEQWFDIDKVVYNDGTIPGKPAPDIYRKAAEKINVAIENCMVFEDAKSGIEAARRAGAGRIIGVASMLEEEQLIAYGAEDTIKDYDKVACFETEGDCYAGNAKRKG